MSRERINLSPHVATELEKARSARSRRDLALAWRHLERAHILSQPSAWLHTRVHLSMFALALRTRDFRELFGQLVRLTVAGLGSAIGRYPRGNTGRARVPISATMPLPQDLEHVLAGARGAPVEAAVEALEQPSRTVDERLRDAQDGSSGRMHVRSTEDDDANRYAG